VPSPPLGHRAGVTQDNLPSIGADPGPARTRTGCTLHGPPLSAPAARRANPVGTVSSWWQTLAVTQANEKDTLKRYLQQGRDALLWKLDGLSEYDARRPMTPTGTNLLGLVKHLAGVEVGYFGDTFGRPFPEKLAWEIDDADLERIDELDPEVLMADLWATPEESREQITDLYRRAWAHSDATIDALPLDAVGHVKWWPPDRNEVTLHQILVHVTTETHRHAGHADIIRELIDGAAGLSQRNDNLPSVDKAWWEAYRTKLEQAAKQADGPN
jgi:hypothetical protein